MKVTYDVVDQNNTVYVQSFFDLPDVPPERALHMAREIERLLVAYPSAKTINIAIEKDADGAIKDVQKPPKG